MDPKEENICRLCLKMSDSEFEVIEEVSREILGVLLIKVNFSKTEEPTMCKNCAENIQKCFDFKSVFINVEDSMVPFISTTNETKVDIIEVFLAENENVESVDHSICRFCLQGVNEGQCKSLDILKTEVVVIELEECIPEMNLEAVEDPVICIQCEASLKNYMSFKKNCWDVEQKIAEYCAVEGVSNEGQVKLSKVLSYCNMLGSVKVEENFSKTEACGNVDIKVEHMVKAEPELNIKDEEDASSDRIPCGASLPNPEAQTGPPFDKEFFQCDRCTYRTENSMSLETHRLTHRKSSKGPTYSCGTCPFRTRHKGNVKIHQLVHSEQTTMYSCELCPYQSKHKHGVKRHMLVHKSPSELTMYKCDLCTFQTRQKFNLRTHQVVHRDPSTITMYKCSECPYEAKLNYKLKRHMLTHKNITEVEMFKCDLCTYWTKRKAYLKRHMGTHKDAAA